MAPPVIKNEYMSMYIDFFCHTYQFFFAKEMHMNIRAFPFYTLYAETKSINFLFIDELSMT